MIKFGDLCRNLRNEAYLSDIERSVNDGEIEYTAFLVYLYKVMLDLGYCYLSEKDFQIIQHCYKEKTNDLS